MPWPDGDAIIASIDRLIAAQEARFAAVATAKAQETEAARAAQAARVQALVSIDDIFAVLPADMQTRLQARIAARLATGSLCNTRSLTFRKMRLPCPVATTGAHDDAASRLPSRLRSAR